MNTSLLPLSRFLTRVSVWTLLVLMLAVPSLHSAVTSTALFNGIPNKRGVCVLIDCDSALVNDVIVNSDYVVYARFADKAVCDAVKVAQASVLGGRFYAEHSSSTNNNAVIPFPNHYADVLVVNNATVLDAECIRATVPRGTFHRISGGSGGSITATTVKPYPSTMDDWATLRPDRNNCSIDTEIKLPLMTHYLSGPLQGTHENSAVVQGRVFGVRAWGGTKCVTDIYKDMVTASSSFNGQILWEKAPATVDSSNLLATSQVVAYFKDNMIQAFDAQSGVLLYHEAIP